MAMPFIIHHPSEDSPMSNHSLTATTTESQALDLLGVGASPSQVAAALGVSESLISQFLAQETFARAVAERRFNSLLKHNRRDDKLDELEDALIKKLENIIPMMYKPSEIIHAFTRINQAKRRGSSAPEQIHQQQTVISLTLPIQIIQQVTVDARNQVVKAGQQDLITVQSGRLPALLQSPQKVPQNVLPQPSRNESSEAA
jgi:predicted transcriptional regulator